ncbi:MAG: hypothetical protein FWH41_09480 [Treponema sp.]|nr:hypothetical protein [Treponema sp.]MCL2139741.1 hypothetical protein [Treponema sp.]
MGVSIRIHKEKVYLDIWHNKIRRWESLGLSVPKDRLQRSEVMRLAEVCKSKKEMQ